MEGISEPLAFLVLLGASVAALGIIFRGARWMVRFLVRMNAAAHIIMYELQPNAGLSIKDSIQRIDHRVLSLEEWRLRHTDEK